MTEQEKPEVEQENNPGLTPEAEAALAEMSEIAQKAGLYDTPSVYKKERFTKRLGAL